MTELQSMFRLVLQSQGNPVVLLVFADKLEELGQDDLAYAYRWAAQGNHWPFVRRKHFHDGSTIAWVQVYDWDVKGRHYALKLPVPDRAQLPKLVYDSIKELPKDEKVYGGISKAFVLLAKGLKALTEKRKVGVL